MLEVNLGNKTMVFGIVIALILSYGMVNFNAVQETEIAFPKASAAVTTEASPDEPETSQSLAEVVEREFEDGDPRSRYLRR